MTTEHSYTGHGEGWITYFLEVYKELKAPWQNLLFENGDDIQHTIIMGFIHALTMKVQNTGLTHSCPQKRSHAIHTGSKND